MTLTSNKTVVIAASILSVLVVLQLAVVFAILGKKATFGVNSHSVQNPAVHSTTAPAFPEKSPELGTTSNTAQSSQALPSVLPDSLPPQSPASSDATPLPELPATAVEPSEVDILLKRAIAARDKGDMNGTLAGLRDAQKLYPDDPKIIAEFAATYEQMGLVDKALAQWKRVVDAGEKAGDLYGVAAEKVRMGITPKDLSGGRDDEGLQPGSTIGLVDVQKNYNTKADGTEEVSLRTPIKCRKNGAIDASKVNIQVQFYDLVNNQEVEPTDAKVTSEWLTAPADWLEDGVEVLRILYTRPPDDPHKPATERKYLGYIVRLYYENELQDVYAEPAKLLQTNPPPVTLQNEIPQ